MTTPLFSPKLSLNFLSGSLDPRITFTRAGNTATVTNADGSISLVNADTARFNYSNGVLQGLLIEETRTNSVTNSLLSGAVIGSPGTPPTSWLVFFAGTTYGIAAIESASYAAGSKLTTTSSAGRTILGRALPVLANTTYTYSLDCQVVSGTNPILQIINISTPLAGSTVSYFVNGVSQSGSSILPVGSHKLAIVYAIGATAGNAEIRFGVGVSSNTTGSAKFSNVQFEQGAFPTSYIPTTTTALTRNADVAVMTGTNFSDWWQAGKGGAQVQAIPSTVSGIRPLVQYDDGTANEIIALRGNTTNPELYVVDGGTPQAQLDAGTIAVSTSYSLTGWWNTNDCKARKDSGTVVTDDTATIPTVTQARLGSDGTNYLNGHLATVNYYDSFFGQSIYTRRKNKVIFSLL